MQSFRFLRSRADRCGAGSRTKSSRSNTFQRRLRCEPLEDRRLLSATYNFSATGPYDGTGLIEWNSDAFTYSGTCTLEGTVTFTSPDNGTFEATATGSGSTSGIDQLNLGDFSYNFEGHGEGTITDGDLLITAWADSGGGYLFPVSPIFAGVTGTFDSDTLEATVSWENETVEVEGTTVVLSGDWTGDLVLEAVPQMPSDIVGRVVGNGDWWVAESNGVDAFTNEPYARWSNGVTWDQVMVGDFNGDGLDDVVGRVQENGDWWVALNDGAGGFTNERWGRWSAAVDWNHVMVGDFNNDGSADIVGRVAGNGDWWVAKSNGIDGFTNERWSRWSTAVDWNHVTTGDFNGDGSTDLVARVAGNGDWWVAKSNGTDGFTNERWTRWSTGVDWEHVMTGDFNDDGSTDLVGRVVSNGDWWVAQSNGTDGFANERWGRWSPNVAWTNVAVGDFNGDGSTDLVGRVVGNGDWWVAKSNGTGFANERWTRWSAAVNWNHVMVGDFNSDGSADLVGRVEANGDWWVAKSNGTDGFANEKWGRWSSSATWEHVMVGNFAAPAAPLAATGSPAAYFYALEATEDDDEELDDPILQVEAVDEVFLSGL